MKTMKTICLSAIQTTILFWVVVIGPVSLTHAVDADILIADFESSDYGDWKVTGQAFASGPARGTLPTQMPVEGYLGQLLFQRRRFDGDAHLATV